MRPCPASAAAIADVGAVHDELLARRADRAAPLPRPRLEDPRRGYDVTLCKANRVVVGEIGWRTRRAARREVRRRAHHHAADLTDAHRGQR